MTRIAISGGGTGGHVFPAIAIADALKSKLADQADILFFGAKGKLEMAKVPQAGYPIVGLWISGFHRKEVLRNLIFPIKLLVSLVVTWFKMLSFKPDVVVGVGGYASGPALKVAEWLNIPTVLQEQNSLPGITNKLGARHASAICVAYDGMDRFFEKDKIHWLGNPIRSRLFNTVTKEKAKSELGFDPSKKLILILGGSLGARSINEAVKAEFQQMMDNQEIQWLWQIGKLYIDEYQEELEFPPHIKGVAFLDRMDLAYAAADLVVTRAGALTISELADLGKASILVPSPNVAEDHQTKNAEAIAKKDGCYIIPDNEGKQRIVPEALELVQNTGDLQRLESNIKKLSRPMAAQKIADIVIDKSKNSKG